MRSTAPKLCGALAATLLAWGCVTSGGAGKGFDGRVKQAAEKLPAAVGFYDEAERALVQGAQARHAAARKLVEEGNHEKARAEFGAAAERYVRFADTYPASEWRVAFRYKAAEYLLFAQQPDRAAAQADKVLADPAANDVTKAMAAHVSAAAWRAVAVQRIRAGELEPMRLTTVEQRAGAPIVPRPPPEPWARFVAAVDAFVPVWEAHPEAAKLPAERNLALTPWAGALIAAEVKYSCDDMEDAQRRLEAVIYRWPAEVDVMEGAVPLLLQSFLVRGDDAGFGAADERMKRVLDQQLAKAGEPRARETLSRLREQVVRLGQYHDFGVARRLMEAGKAAEAAAAFERFAAEHADVADAAGALFNAAKGWEAAGAPEKATAAREALVAKYGDSKMAPMAALHLAADASKRADHSGAARYYAAFLERWPGAPERCIAMQNVGHELDVLGEKAGAAERYLSFGADPKCAVERSNEAAKALYQSGKLFKEAKQKAKAKEAFEAATRVKGATDPTALRLIEDATRQIKGL